MNKADLVKRVATASRISKKQAATAVDTTVDSIKSAAKKGDYTVVDLPQEPKKQNRSSAPSSRRLKKVATSGKKRAPGSDHFLAALEQLSEFY